MLIPQVQASAQSLVPLMVQAKLVGTGWHAPRSAHGERVQTCMAITVSSAPSPDSREASGKPLWAGHKRGALRAEVRTPWPGTGDRWQKNILHSWRATEAHDQKDGCVAAGRPLPRTPIHWWHQRRASNLRNPEFIPATFPLSPQMTFVPEAWRKVTCSPYSSYWFVM